MSNFLGSLHYIPSVFLEKDLHRLNTSLEKSMIQIEFRKTMFLGLASYSFQLSK